MDSRGRHHGRATENDMTARRSSSRAPKFEDKLASETHLRRFTENVLDSRQQEIENRESEKDRLAVRVEALEKQLAGTQRQLAEAQDQVFRLQPRRKDITESEAKDGYKTLVGNVQRWVENRAAGVIEELDAGRLNNRAVPPGGSRLVTLLKEQSRRCLTVGQSDEFHIIGAIMNYLHLTLFAKPFYCPLDDSEEDRTSMWIDGIENTMSRLPRDVAHCREWRSETLTALTNQAIFKTRRQQHLNNITDDLTSLVSVIAPRTPLADLHSSIRRSIVEPAADLVHQLHLAPSIYSLKWTARTAATRLENYQCLNLANGGTVLDLTGTKPASPARRSVTYLFDVAPGLFVERIDGGRKLGMKAVVRPTVLIDNAEGGIPQSPTVMKWLWDNTPAALGHNRSASRASSRRPAASVVSASGRQRY
ncbi:hypothetical protein FHETE_5490 [Fusarium heterosporum]|uniref:Uncharacterized protein n=1 Tax=Fusarium heterosporum TaxID=42747 RepID=A0A8H5TET0_FUSHE|nr:hypothetical protein FHETE_5490 [Fusarium heterosporum]